MLGISRVAWESEGCCNISGMLFFSLTNVAILLFLFLFCRNKSISNYLFKNQIDQEREGEQIDRGLLKNVLDIFVEIGMGDMEYYENDFEAFMLKDTSAYYSRKASSWILEDSCPDYMLKVNFYTSLVLKFSSFQFFL